MADDPLTDLKPLFPGIKKEAILKTCIQLSAFTPAGLGDDYFRAMLEHVWFSVNQLLEQDQSLNRPPASLREFNDNVKDRGEESIFNLLRDRAEDVRKVGL